MAESLIDGIRKELFARQDIKYRDFQGGLIPGKSCDVMIGVRTPVLRKYAKELTKNPDADVFLKDLPHRYFDEDQLHAFIISEFKDFDRAMEEVEKFLPYEDNWATCDQMSTKVFKNNKQDVLLHIRNWIQSQHTYTVRFGIGMLMQHFLDEDFDPEYPELVSGVRSDEYYVNMMIAWYFATALAKQYEAVLPYIRDKRLDTWTHNKTIQKAVESYRITDEQKSYLKTLRISTRKA